MSDVIVTTQPKPRVGRPAPAGETLRDYMLRISEEHFLRRGLSPAAADVNDADLFRAFSEIGGWTDFDLRIKTWMLGGFTASRDSLRGVYIEHSLPNYLANQIGVPSSPPIVQRLARGHTAVQASMSVTVESWRLARLAAMFEIDERDVIDSAVTVDALALAVAEIGSAFRRAIQDALWGLLFSNPLLADGTALFAVARGNLSTAALASTSLDDGYAAIAGQTRQVTVNPDVFAHDNLKPSVLLVPPILATPAVTLIATMSPGNAPPLLDVRSESRLSANAFVNPLDDTVYSGNAKNWLLCADGAESPSIVLGLLNGRKEPTLSPYELRQGAWGRGYSAQLSIGVKAVSGRGLYFSDGSV